MEIFWDGPQSNLIVSFGKFTVFEAIMNNKYEKVYAKNLSNMISRFKGRQSVKN